MRRNMNLSSFPCFPRIVHRHRNHGFQDSQLQNYVEWLWQNKQDKSFKVIQVPKLGVHGQIWASILCILHVLNSRLNQFIKMMEIAFFSESDFIIGHFEYWKHTPAVFTPKQLSLKYGGLHKAFLLCMFQHSRFIHCVRYGTKKQKDWKNRE